MPHSNRGFTKKELEKDLKEELRMHGIKRGRGCALCSWGETVDLRGFPAYKCKNTSSFYFGKYIEIYGSCKQFEKDSVWD